MERDEVMYVIIASGMKQQEAIENNVPPIPVMNPDCDSEKKAFMTFAGDRL